jgi:hypothetical protein
VAVLAYVTYYAGYMLYDNLLSFTVIAVYDLAAIAIVDAVVTGRLDGLHRALARALRQPIAP